MQLEQGSALVSNLAPNKGGRHASGNGSSFLMNTSHNDTLTHRQRNTLHEGKFLFSQWKKIRWGLQQQTPFSHCTDLATIIKLALDLKRRNQQVELVLCHACYSQGDEGLQIIQRKSEVSYFRSEPIIQMIPDRPSQCQFTHCA